MSAKIIVLLTADTVVKTGRVSYRFVTKLPQDAMATLNDTLGEQHNHTLYSLACTFGVIESRPYGDDEINPFVLMQQGAAAHADHVEATTRLSWNIFSSRSGGQVEAGSCDNIPTAIGPLLQDFPAGGVYLLDTATHEALKPSLEGLEGVVVYHAHIPGTVHTG